MKQTHVVKVNEHIGFAIECVFRAMRDGLKDNAKLDDKERFEEMKALAEKVYFEQFEEKRAQYDLCTFTGCILGILADLLRATMAERAESMGLTSEQVSSTVN